MRIIDLTHTINPDIPLFPGTDAPAFSSIATQESNGFSETRIVLTSHTGTHMDAPSHILTDGLSLDQFPASQFIGSAVVVDCSDVKDGRSISMDYVMKRSPQIEEAEFVLFRTGWEQLWHTKEYLGHYPILDDSVISYLIKRPIKGIGLDTMSPDALADSALEHHKALLGNNCVIIENLTNLSLLGSGLFTFIALPLKYNCSDGSPVRAVACFPDDD